MPAHDLDEDQIIVREESLALDGTAQRITQSVIKVDGVAALAPGLRDLVASATARVLHRTGGDPMGIDLTRADGGLKVRIDAHFDDSRPVAEIADDVCSVVRRELDEPVDIDLRVLSRHGGPSH